MSHPYRCPSCKIEGADNFLTVAGTLASGADVEFWCCRLCGAKGGSFAVLTEEPETALESWAESEEKELGF